jgi:hypothetical protein
MGVEGKGIALLNASHEYLRKMAEINKLPYFGFAKAALESFAIANYDMKSRAISSTPANMFNKDGTLNKRKLDAKRRKDLRNGAVIIGPNIKGESR